jgi:hypothetical protein
VKCIVSPSVKALLAWFFSLTVIARLSVKKQSATQLGKKEVRHHPRRIIDTLKNGVLSFYPILKTKKPISKSSASSSSSVLSKGNPPVSSPTINASLFSELLTEALKEFAKEAGKKAIKLSSSGFAKIKKLFSVFFRLRRRRKLLGK